MTVTIFGREPLAILSAVRLVLLALIGVGVFNLTEQQMALVLGAVEGVLLVIGRQNVASPATLRQAGTSLHQVRAVADPEVDATLRVIGPDAAAVQAADTGAARHA